MTQDSPTGSSAACEEPEAVKSHDVCESSPGSEPAGLDHRAQPGDAATASSSCVSEPEAAAVTAASERSAGSHRVLSKQVYTHREVSGHRLLLATRWRKAHTVSSFRKENFSL